jgi:amino acid permease/TM2 domain-containing membrane protein YozV
MQGRNFKVLKRKNGGGSGGGGSGGGGSGDGSYTEFYTWKSMVGMKPIADTSWCENICTLRMVTGVGQILANTVGTGLFTIPYIVSHLGLLCSFLTILSVAIANLGGSYFLLVALEQHRISVVSNHHYIKEDVPPTDHYPQIVIDALSTVMGLLFYVCYIIALISSLAGHFKIAYLYIKCIIRLILVDSYGYSDQDSDLHSNGLAFLAVCVIISVLSVMNFLCYKFCSDTNRQKATMAVENSKEKEEESLKPKETTCFRKLLHNHGLGSLVTVAAILILLVYQYFYRTGIMNLSTHLNHNWYCLEFWTQRSSSSNKTFFGTIFSMVPVLAMSFLNQHVVLKIVQEMYKDDNIVKHAEQDLNTRVLKSVSCCAIVLCQLIAFIVYITVGTFGFLTFEFSTEKNLMNNVSFDDELWLGVRVLILILYFHSCFPVLIETFINAVSGAMSLIIGKCVSLDGLSQFMFKNRPGDDALSVAKRLEKDRTILYYAGCMALNILFAWLGVYGGLNLFQIYQIAGSFADPWIIYMMPSLSCFVLSWKYHKERLITNKVYSVLMVIIFLLGFMIWIFGTYMSIATNLGQATFF